MSTNQHVRLYKLCVQLIGVLICDEKQYANKVFGCDNSWQQLSEFRSKRDFGQ